MTHNLPRDAQRCDGEIWSDVEPEYCQRRETCQRYIAHREYPSNKMSAWVIALRNCNKFVQGIATPEK